MRTVYFVRVIALLMRLCRLEPTSCLCHMMHIQIGSGPGAQIAIRRSVNLEYSYSNVAEISFADRSGRDSLAPHPTRGAKWRSPHGACFVAF